MNKVFTGRYGLHVNWETSSGKANSDFSVASTALGLLLKF